MCAEAGDTQEIMKTNRQPNLLFIMSDQQKATSLDLYNQGGNSIETTSLRKIADSGITCNARPMRWPGSTARPMRLPDNNDRGTTNVRAPQHQSEATGRRDS